MECKCLQVEASARRDEMVGQDCKICKRSSLARSVMCIMKSAIFVLVIIGFETLILRFSYV